jgi:hypothetical protein
LDIDCRFELLVAVVAIPVVAAVTIALGLVLAGVALWVLWPLVLVCGLRNGSRSSPPASDGSSAATQAVSRPVDPARALLDALGEDVTGGQR